MGFTLTPKRRLIITIGISFSFFVAEIASKSSWATNSASGRLLTGFPVAFLTKSLALIADAFHYASLPHFKGKLRLRN